MVFGNTGSHLSPNPLRPSLRTKRHYWFSSYFVHAVVGHPERSTRRIVYDDLVLKINKALSEISRLFENTKKVFLLSIPNLNLQGCTQCASCCPFVTTKKTALQNPHLLPNSFLLQKFFPQSVNIISLLITPL